MFIAHVPAGYILSTTVAERLRQMPASGFAVICAGCIGAIAPDIDMAWFYLVDERQTHHHKYVTHWPVVWLTLMLASAFWYRSVRTSKAGFLTLVFSVGTLLHLFLDSFVGDIWWFAPFVDRAFAMFTVPALFEPWWLSFILHWSFAVELSISLWALLIYRRRSGLTNAAVSVPD